MKSPTLLLFTVSLASCQPLYVAPAAAGGGTVATDDDSLRGIMRTASYRDTGFARVNDHAYATMLAGGTGDINVYVSLDAEPWYRAIEPEAAHTDRTFPVDGVIVREVLGADGERTKVTVMVRRADSYFTQGGNFLYGVTSPDGTPLTDSDGVVQWGMLDKCTTCHYPRAGDAFLFGVPNDNRTAATP